MADKDDLKEALEGSKDLAAFDLRDADLAGHNFTGCDLSNTKLEGANLTGAIFSDCDLTTTELNGVNLTNASCFGSKFSGPIYGVNFSSADLRNSDFASIISGISSCNFDKADMRGTNFSEVTFYEDNSFRDVEFDVKTEFEGAKIPRSIFKKELFQYFARSRGELHRLEPLENGLVETEVESNQVTIQSHPNQRLAATIGARLDEKSTEYAFEIADFTDLFATQIGWWESKKPNHDDDDWQMHLDFLKQIHSGFKDLTKQIELLKTQSTIENQQQAGEQAINLREQLTSWLNDFKATAADSGHAMAHLSMIGGASCIMAGITGADPTAALAVATASIGGPALAKNVGMLIGKNDPKS